MPPTTPRPQALFFDVNETLLDLAPLRQAVNRAFDQPNAFRQWFGLLLQYSQTATLTGNYADFGTIGRAAFDMVATVLNTQPLADAQKQHLIDVLTSLPAYPDVAPGLARLREAGYRLFTLTNSAPAALQKQLAAAGLTEYFEQALSVDAVRRYKPHPDTYHYAARQAGLEPSQCLLVAAHGWDVAGALAAGLQAAFIARPGQPLYPLAPAPTCQAPDVQALAAQLA